MLFSNQKNNKFLTYGKSFLLLIAIMTLLLNLSSCDSFFSLRTPSKPDNDQLENSSLSIAELVANFEKSLKYNQFNLYYTLFIDSINNGYNYEFSSNASDIEIPEIFQEWSREKERLFLQETLKYSYFKKINLSYDGIPETLEDSIFFELDYDLTLDQNSQTTLIKGHSKFLFRKVNNIWYIHKWFDEFNEISEAISFSKLKESYAGI